MSGYKALCSLLGPSSNKISITHNWQLLTWIWKSHFRLYSSWNILPVCCLTVIIKIMIMPHCNLDIRYYCHRFTRCPSDATPTVIMIHRECYDVYEPKPMSWFASGLVSSANVNNAPDNALIGLGHLMSGKYHRAFPFLSSWPGRFSLPAYWVMSDAYIILCNHNWTVCCPARYNILGAVDNYAHHWSFLIYISKM